MAIASPGVGSNLDVSGIVSKLMAVESQPLTVLQKKEASYQAKLTAYGAIKGTLSSFQNAVSGLSDASKFMTLNATTSDASVLSATTGSSAVAGSYAVTVNTLAQSQSLSTAGQSNKTSAIGSGTATTLTFQFGTISGGSLANGKYSGSTFSQDASQANGTVTIDSSNNSLQGIADAINSAKIGVTASIVNDGDASNPYHIVVTSNSTGASKSMKITSNGGDAAISSLLSYDPAATQNLTQTSVAQNASLSVNGLAITSASNSVTGAISGVTLNLAKASGASTTLTVSNNSAAVVSAVQSLVQSYNSTNTTLNTFTRYNATTKTGGVLLGDASIQSIQSKLRSTMSSALSGVEGNTLTNLSQVGLSFQKDGSLSLDTSKLQTALNSNFSDFASLFAAFGKSSDSLVSYVGSTVNSKAGSYAVEVTTLATQGKSVGSDKATQAALVGSDVAGLTIDATNDKLKVTVDGGPEIIVSLTQAGPYGSAAALASQTQTDINNALSAAGQSGRVKVTESGGKLSVASDSFGASSSVTINDDTGTLGATTLLGATPASSRIATITTGVNDQLTVGVNGTSATITIAPGIYTASSLASQIQSALNGTTAFTNAGVAVSVTQSNDVLTITSNRYGSSSAVSIASGSAMNSLFGSSTTSTLGADVVGKINGVVAAGSGQFLTGASGDASDGLKVQVLGGSLGSRGTINYSQGYAYNLRSALDNFLSSSGTIASSTDNANRMIADLQKRADALNVKLSASEKRYQAQFSALDTLIGKMNTTATYLTQQLANLPSINS